MYEYEGVEINVQAFCSSLQTNYTIDQNTQQDM